MHQSGQALKRVSPFSGKMTFTICPPEDVVYKVDVYKSRSQWEYFSPEYKHDYRQLYEASGWEMVGAINPYVIFRKSASQAQSPEDLELYSDEESRYAIGADG